MRDTTTATVPLSGGRIWFLADALVTGANAIAYLALGHILPGLLGATSTLFFTAGLLLAVVTVGLLIAARSLKRPMFLPTLLATINAVWAAASLFIAAANPFGLTVVGVVWTVAQGVVVLAFAILQFRALKRSADALGGHGRARQARSHG
ncbi:hypothetical protein ACFFGH_25740 [Lysobacter korlensis]|uniref:Integral membrane protein n=1 Tax=Lysobacter korlensis TaxID=553636 RepID=A0ABV6RW94_9GAMM